MTTITQLDNRLDELESDLLGELDPGLCLFLSPPEDADEEAFHTALKMDWEARRRFGAADAIFIGVPEHLDDFRGRLSHALYRLRETDGVHIPLKRYVRFVHGRVEGDVPPGREGPAQHFTADVTEEQVNRVWTQTVRGDPPETVSYDHKFRPPKPDQ